MKTSSDQPIRVVIVARHTLVRAGLVLIVGTHTGLSVIGEAGEINGALAIVNIQKPDIILLQLDSGSDINPESIPKLLKESKSSRIVLISHPDEVGLALSALKHGALGIVFMTDSPEILVKAIQKVQEGEVWIERSLIADIIYDLSNNKEPNSQNPETENIDELTNRERDVIQLIGRGLNNRQIAEKLCLSETTVRHHLSAIYHKCGVASRLELLVYANRHGII